MRLASGSVTQMRPSIPVVMPPVLEALPGRGYLVIVPSGSTAPTSWYTRLSSVNQTRPSGRPRPMRAGAGR